MGEKDEHQPEAESEVPGPTYPQAFAAVGHDRDKPAPAPAEDAQAEADATEGDAEAQEQRFEVFLADRQEVLEYGLADLSRVVERFLTELQELRPDLHVERMTESLRAKSAGRTKTKASRKNIEAPEALLQPREDQERGLPCFPVGDLLGLRVLVRSLRDKDIIKDAVESRRNIGEGDYLFVDDINEHPRTSGYRALHIDGALAVERAGETYLLPFEVQVKTLAQHVFGQHTHEDAYVRDEINSDPRFGVVRRLQRAMAESLNAVDLTQAEIEGLSEGIREQIAGGPAGEDIEYASVMSVVRQTHGATLTVVEASAIAKRARDVGLASTEEFRAAVDLDGEIGRRATENLKRMLPTPPNAPQHISEVLLHLKATAGEQPDPASEQN